MIKNRKDISQEEIAQFLEGRDPEEGIVNLEYSYGDDFITVYTRGKDDLKHIERQPFYPFLWATEDACKRLYDGDKKMVSQQLKMSGIWCKALDVQGIREQPQEKMVNGYKILFYATKPMSYKNFLNFFKKAGNPVYSDNKDKKDDDPTDSKNRRTQYLVVTPQEQFMISTGKRMFKGFDDYDQLLRLIFDLETEGLDPKQHRITLNGVRFNREVIYKGKKIHFERILKVKGNTKEELDKSELDVIDKMLRIIYTFKPDIITAHNGEVFDWPYVMERCRQLGTTLEDMSAKYFNGKPIKKMERESILKLGGEIEKFQRTVVPGCIITDSMHAVRRAQATDSNFKEFNLKYATKYLGLNKKNRVYIPGGEIENVRADQIEHYAFNDENGDWYLLDEENGSEFKFDGNTKRTFIPHFNSLADGYVLVNGEYIADRYLLDDLYECDKVEYALNGTDFMLTKIIPVNYQKVCTMGTASQWKAIMMAWSYENNLAIPKAENTGSFTGGLSRLLKVGYVDNVIKLDYDSLYPSILLTWGIEDDIDITGVMLMLLEYVLTSREVHKGLKKTAEKIKDSLEELFMNGKELTNEENIKYLEAVKDFKIEDNRQGQLKKTGNSYFGSYGSNNGQVFPWKSKDCAERTTCTGRMSLRLMIKHFHDLGYQPIVGDTDGFNFKLPETFRYTKENPYISNGLGRKNKQGQKYTGFEADVAEFNDTYMRDFHYSPISIQKMNLGIDEIVASTINFSRKNYADYFPEKPYPEDVKIVGNTLKSKKLPQYIEKFIDKAVRSLLQKKGQEFLDSYYDYIDKIYNYKIPLKMLASKGKVKKSIKEYMEDCKTITKAGRPKSRQAWMELAIANNLNVNVGDTIYYINIGKSKSQSDAKKVTHYYLNEGLFNEKNDVTARLKKEHKKAKTSLSFDDWLKEVYPQIQVEYEMILNCKLIPTSMIESDKDYFCEEGEEYNVPKYLDQFNNRIKPMLVCFDKSIRDKILITNPKDRPYFTEEECELCNGQPNKEGDQDTYEKLMTMDDKEIKFWENHPQWDIPFLNECGMNWEEILKDYHERIEREKELGINKIKELFETTLYNNMSGDDFEKFSEGELPKNLAEFIELNPETGDFVSREYPDIVIGTINDVLDAEEYLSNMATSEDEE